MINGSESKKSDDDDDFRGRRQLAFTSTTWQASSACPVSLTGVSLFAPLLVGHYIFPSILTVHRAEVGLNCAKLTFLD